MDASSLRSNFKPRLKQDEKSAEIQRRLLDAAILEGLVIGTEARDKQVVDKVLDALKSLCAFLLVPPAAQ